MTWPTKKSQRSSAPSNMQGRDGARPLNSSGAAVPPTGPAVAGPAADPANPSGRLSAHEAPDEPDPRDQRDRPDAPDRPDVPGPRDGVRTPADSAPEHPTPSTPASGPSDADADFPEPTGPAGGSAAPGSPGPRESTPAGHESALSAARLNSAFRSAARSVWPGTEDRQDEAAPAGPGPGDRLRSPAWVAWVARAVQLRPARRGRSGQPADLGAPAAAPGAAPAPATATGPITRGHVAAE